MTRLSWSGSGPRAQRLTHLWSAGMTYQGAHLVLVALMASSNAAHVVIPEGAFFEISRRKLPLF